MAEVVLRRQDLHPISEETRKRIAAIRDEDIDCSDIPQLKDSFLAGAVRGRFYRPDREAATPREGIDAVTAAKEMVRRPPASD